MNLRKEVIIASVFALLFALGLGAVSYSLFTDVPPPEKPRNVLDVYTQKGGVGANMSGRVFEPFDDVFIYAYLTQGGEVPVKNVQVNFTLKRPNDVEILKTARTNETGVASTDFALLPSEGPIIGTWNILANADVDGNVVSDLLSLKCQPLSGQIIAYTKRNGQNSAVFLPKDEVVVDAQVKYKDFSIAENQVSFEVRAPNGTIFLPQTSQTDTSGVATVSFQIPWPSETSLGVWHATVESEVYQQPVNTTIDFECQLLQSVIDVYTQRGGQGQNMPSGTFVLNETVTLYGEIRDLLNETVIDKLISFEVKQPGHITLMVLVGQTNSSGIATAGFRIPPVESFVGTWEVYAWADYNGTVLLDTLTFRCEPQE